MEIQSRQCSIASGCLVTAKIVSCWLVPDIVMGDLQKTKGDITMNLGLELDLNVEIELQSQT